MKRLIIDFRTNFYNCDYDTKLFFRCDTANDLKVAKEAICCYLDNEIANATSQEKKEGGEG